MKYSFPPQNVDQRHPFSFINEPTHYLSTDISKFSQVHPKANVIRISSQIPTIKIHYLEASPKPKINNHFYKSQNQCLCCSQSLSKKSSLNFMDDTEQNQGCCRLSKTKHETSFISRVSQKQQLNNEDFFDSEIFTKILLKGQLSTQENLHSILGPSSPYHITDTSIVSQASVTNPGIRLGLRIIVNKIETLKKKRAAFKLIRHLKIVQFVFKLNYIVKVRSFLNLEFAFHTIKEKQKLRIFQDSIIKAQGFCQKQERALKAKGFLRLKMIRSTDKASLIPFVIIFKKIMREKVFKDIRDSFDKIKLFLKY